MGKFDIYLLIVVTSSLFGRCDSVVGWENMILACAGVTLFSPSDYFVLSDKSNY
jgi:hypothetical protein